MSGAALTCLLMAGCAGAKPPHAPPPPKPMLTPQPPPSPAEFNAGNAKPLPIPRRLGLEPLEIPPAPGPLTDIPPLPLPEPLVLSADPVTAQKAPPQMAKPLLRPSGPSPQPSGDSDDPAVTASPPPAGAPGGVEEDAGIGTGFRLLFPPGSPELPAAAAIVIHELADTMAREPALRLRLAAYASGEAENPVPARRLSLQRALKVREALVGEGVNTLRIDVMALGITAPAPPRDRVDLIPIH